MNLPADICNQALDAAAVDFTLGDIQEGTRPAQVLLRAYGQCVRQLQRAANWDFCRKTTPMTLLADATGNTPAVGTNVIAPWIYEYAYPNDCLKARFVPWNYPYQNPGQPPGNITPPAPTSPIMTGLGQPPFAGQRLIPARFLVANDPNYPATPGGDPDQMPQGQSPVGNTVICTNVQNALLVYTALQLYPTIWDALFRAALVGYLASEICLPLAKDKKLGMQLQDRNIAKAKAKIQEARLVDGNEGNYDSTIRVDWMTARFSGGGSAGWGGASDGGGPGVFSYGYDSCVFADGTAF